MIRLKGQPIGTQLSDVQRFRLDACRIVCTSVVLNSIPSADVTIGLASTDLTEGTASPNTLTFTTVNWNAPQTVIVTGVDDDIEDGNQEFTVAFDAIVSDDTAYSGMTTDPVSVTNIDNETAGFIVGIPSGDTSETGDQATISVVLSSAPSADVTLTLASSDTGEGTVGVDSLVFTAENWNAPQTVTVTGVNDDFADGNQPYAIVFDATVSDDAAYAAITPDNVAVSNTDNDTAGFDVSEISGHTSENSSNNSADFTVVLTSQPTADVSIGFDTNNSEEGEPDVTTLTFTSVNWSTPQTVTVTGVDDAIEDGNQAYAIVFQASTSTDANYAGITPGNVAVTNDDNDIFTSCLTLLTARPSLAGQDGLHMIDPDGLGTSYSPVEVYCDMTADGGGYTFLKVSSTTALPASDAEAHCASVGMQLFIPRTEAHLMAALSVARDESIISGTTEYLTILGIYPTVQGATCTNVGFNSTTCTAWQASDNGPYWVSNREDIAEPNGDNVIDGSMGYSFDTDNNASYNDFPVVESLLYMCDTADKLGVAE